MRPPGATQSGSSRRNASSAPYSSLTAIRSAWNTLRVVLSAVSAG